MTTAEQQREIDKFLQSLHDQAVISLEKGNTLAAAYMATICGMWSNRFGRVKNLFESDDNYLYKWFLNGHDDFSQAIQMSAEVRKKQLEKETADAEARAKGEDPNEKKSKWSMKLW